jgi:hypothetical protein
MIYFILFIATNCTLFTYFAYFAHSMCSHMVITCYVYRHNTLIVVTLTAPHVSFVSITCSFHLYYYICVVCLTLFVLFLTRLCCLKCQEIIFTALLTVSISFVLFFGNIHTFYCICSVWLSFEYYYDLCSFHNT